MLVFIVKHLLESRDDKQIKIKAVIDNKGAK